MRAREREQQAKEPDSLSYFVLSRLSEQKIPDAEKVAKRIRAAFDEFPNWRRSEGELRELRKNVTLH
jgi:type I restriction enzyme R subunit